MAADVFTIGVDVGGTKTAAALVQFPAATIMRVERIATRPDRGADAVLADMAAMVKRLLDFARSEGVIPYGIGIGVPELVDLDGRITSNATIDWRGVNFGTCFPGTQVCLDSDVRASARAESQFGAGRTHRVFVYVSVGTGISYCLVQDAQPFKGARGNALVLGSGPDVWQCNACGVRNVTTLEDFASGPGLVRSYRSATQATVATAEEVFAAAQRGDAAAVELVIRAGEALGNRIALVVNLLDPEVVVVGGGLGLAGDDYWQAMCNAARSAIWAANARDIPILKAELGVDAGLVGAASLVWR